MEPCLSVFFLEFPLLAQSSHPFVVTDWINLKPSPIHMAWPRCRRFSWWELMLSCSMDGKKQEKKAPGTGFLRPLWIPLFQRCFWKSFCRFLKQFLAYYSVSVWRAVIGWSRGWCNCSSSWAACGYRFADVRQQVGVTGQLLDIYPVLLSIGQTPPDECLQYPKAKARISFLWQKQEAFDSLGAGPTWQPQCWNSFPRHSPALAPGEARAEAPGVQCSAWQLQ